MRVDLFDFELPPEQIALRPVKPRDAARLLVIRPHEVPQFEDCAILDLPNYLASGDLLAVNDTRVIRARLSGVRSRAGTSARIEATLIGREGEGLWRALARPAKKLRPGDVLSFAGTSGDDSLSAKVLQKGHEGEVLLNFSLSGTALDAAIEQVGAMPLPPYISSRRPADEQDAQDYQTLFAQKPGAVAAPTATLHFTPRLLNALATRGVAIRKVTLHVGA